MTEEAVAQQRAESAELAAGTGFTFEDAVGAYFLAALLEEGFAPGIENRTVCRVASQQRGFKEPLDDLVVDFRDTTGAPARLSLQVKRSLTVSAAVTNTDFREVIQNSWRTRQKNGFRKDTDRYGAAVGQIAKEKARDLVSLCEMARASVDTAHFVQRFASGGSASVAVGAIRSDIASVLASLDGRNRSDAEIHDFLAHFVLVQFDFLHSGATDVPEVTTRLRNCLAPGNVDRAPLLWTTLRQMCRDAGGYAAQFDRPKLVQLLKSNFGLRAAPSLQADLDKISELARAWVADISNDVGGTHLDRTALADKLNTLLDTFRFIQITGLPGSGKSVLLRQRIESELQGGPVLFLKADRLEGRGWTSFATQNGLSGAALTDLLLDIGATGSRTLFIDGVDRIEKDHQPIVLDVLRAILGSPLLDDWKVVVSVRDTGIEPLRNWLGDVLGRISVVSLDVTALDDEEARALASAQPHLRSLLFGPESIQQIARRPFFLKILSQAYIGVAGSAAGFQPQSELDLIENWWARGGYDSAGQNALERQRSLIEIGAAQARHLSQAVPLRELTAFTFALVEQLVVDGILRHVRRGISVRFAHDILFEWAFFHVLSDKGQQWLAEIHAFGEPPAVARVAELLAQYEYREGKTWTTTLQSVVTSGMRSQWTRAWLLGPVASEVFSKDEAQFYCAASASDFQLFRKALVWFQAERTTPNPIVLLRELSADERTRIADYLGWPSDLPTWQRFIAFLLRRAAEIPVALYADMISVIGVWQNAYADRPNRISTAMVTQCATWLRELDARSLRGSPDKNSKWDALKETEELHSELVSLVLRSANSVPAATEEYLKRLIAQESLRDENFSEVVGYSPTLSRTHPALLVDLTLKHLKKELPDDKAARVERERAARTRVSWHLDLPHYSVLDWNKLSIDHDVHNFYPASPLREPFHSLFEYAPEQGIRLLNDVCNHAVAAWRQLHRHVRESPRPGTPLPLVITFPWGTQEFWGGDREYLWYRGINGPDALECGLMAVETWCFGELEKGRPVDELIRLIVEGNKSIAILGVAVLLALHTQQVSETVLPLVTAQRLWPADRQRMGYELTGTVLNLVGFTRKSDIPHAKAIQAGNARPARRQHLAWLASLYVLNSEFGERARTAILAFKDNLPFQLEEHRSNPAAREYLAKQAAEYAEAADLANYQMRKLPEQEGLVEIRHVSRSASEPENVAKLERANLTLQQGNLFAWAEKVFESGKVDDPARFIAALELARKLDNKSLYKWATADHDIEMRRGALAAVAAVVLEFREGRTTDEMTWARDVLSRARAVPEVRSNFWSPQSEIPWEPRIFVARGLGADLRAGTASKNAARDLLALVAHPLELVSLAALQQTAAQWDRDPKLAWAALQVALALCNVERPPPDEPRGPGTPLHSDKRIMGVLATAQQYCRRKPSLRSKLFGSSTAGWPDLPGPPPAWVEVEGPHIGGAISYGDEFDREDVEDPRRGWVDPETHWYSQYAGKVLRRIPIEKVVASKAKEPLLSFIAQVLDWTIAKNSPPWVKKGRRDRESSRLFEWNRALGSTLGRLLGLLSLAESGPRFLKPILQLEGEVCWALLEPLVVDYICRYIYDAPDVPQDAIELLGQCLDRFLKSRSFDPNSYSAGKFYGMGEPRLLEALMFIAVERAPLAARFVNGDWSEISLILPLVDRLVRAGGWSGSVMYQFLLLCERSKDVYPAGVFADQVLDAIGDGSQLRGWRGTFIPARIAGLVQHFASRETPMSTELGQKLLRVLDRLVDIGDRRSAALQQSESFREIRLT